MGGELIGLALSLAFIAGIVLLIDWIAKGIPEALGDDTGLESFVPQELRSATGRKRGEGLTERRQPTVTGDVRTHREGGL